jgi:folate-binding protein YgfZ
MPVLAWSALMPDHLGNPLGEQRKLAVGQAYVERDDQRVIRVSGPDAKKWLHSLLSQDILNLQEGDSAEALLLTPQGHIEQQLKIVAAGPDLLVIVSADRAAALLEWLGNMRFRSQVEIAASDLRVFGTFADVDGTIWRDGFASENPKSARYRKDTVSFGYRELISDSKPDLEEVGQLAYHALRIAAGRPEIADVDERSLPHEFDWLNSAVHLSKGCYRGQEAVAKVHNLGHPPRRLALLHFDSGDQLVNKGDEVFYLDKPAGKILVGALHYELGSIALALLSRATPYLELSVKSGESLLRAQQEVIVPADAGKAANLPRPSAFKLSGKK